MKKEAPRVRLEPELEELVSELDLIERRRLLEKLERWTHQLRVWVRITAYTSSRKPRPISPHLPRRLLCRN